MADKGRCPHFKAALIEGTAGILSKPTVINYESTSETNT